MILDSVILVKLQRRLNKVIQVELGYKCCSTHVSLVLITLVCNSNVIHVIQMLPFFPRLIDLCAMSGNVGSSYLHLNSACYQYWPKGWYSWGTRIHPWNEFNSLLIAGSGEEHSCHSDVNSHWIWTVKTEIRRLIFVFNIVTISYLAYMYISFRIVSYVTLTKGIYDKKT